MTQLAKRNDHGIERADALQPTNVSEAMQMAQSLVASKLLPAGITTPEAAFAIIVTGNELGLSAMQALRSIHIIKGKPTLSADLILALVKSNPACQSFQLVESTDRRAFYRTQRVGEEPTSMEFTMQEAAQAGLLSNENWKKYPKAMLRARCIAALARAVYPDVVLGIYEPDELAEHKAPAPAPGDVPRAPDSTADATVEPEALTPELRASLFKDRIDKAQTMGELQEAFGDAYAARAELPPALNAAIKAAKDERKKVLSAQEAA